MIKKNKAIIFKADYGFGLAHNQSPTECVLSLTLYGLDDDMFYNLFFREDKIPQVLRELHNDYAPDSMQQLVHTFVEVLPGDNRLEVPKGIRADYRIGNHPFVMADNKSFWEE